MWRKIYICVLGGLIYFLRILLLVILKDNFLSHKECFTLIKYMKSLPLISHMRESYPEGYPSFSTF